MHEIRDAQVESPLDVAVVRTFQKFLRDLLVNLLVVAPLMLDSGEFQKELLLPAGGLAVWRTLRDVCPELFRFIRHEK